MSTNYPGTNNAAETEKSKTQNPSYNNTKEGWSWIPIVLGITVLLPTGIWIWPHIPAEWTPDNDSLIKIAIAIAVIALGLKLNTWLKNKNEGAFDSKTMGGGGSSSSSSQSTTTIPELKSIQSKPLTKSHNMSYGGGKGAAKEVGHYRHEDKMGGEVDKITLKGWGGSEGGGGSGDTAGRGVQKKPVRR